MFLILKLHVFTHEITWFVLRSHEIIRGSPDILLESTYINYSKDIFFYIIFTGSISYLHEPFTQNTWLYLNRMLFLPKSHEITHEIAW